MKTEILPKESSRAEAFSLWMSSPMPMVTLVKTLNVQKVKKRARYAKPLFLPNNIIMCDTGAYMQGGKLSCVDVLSQKVWQA